MVLLVSITRFPASKAKEVGKRYLEVTKKYPTGIIAEMPITKDNTLSMTNFFPVIIFSPA